MIYRLNKNKVLGINKTQYMYKDLAKASQKMRKKEFKRGYHSTGFFVT